MRSKGVVGSDDFEKSEGTQRMVNIQDKKKVVMSQRSMTCCPRT